jgi:hypothetical protein
MSGPTKVGESSWWMDSGPRTLITADSPENEPTKPSKPGSVGFEGVVTRESSKIEWSEGAAELARHAELSRAGVSVMNVRAALTIGVLRDLGRPEIRAALHIPGSRGLAVRSWIMPVSPRRLNRLFQEHGITGQPDWIATAVPT